MEGMIGWIVRRCASSAAAQEPATPPATHTDTGRYRREGGRNSKQYKHKTQSSHKHHLLIYSYTYLAQVIKTNSQMIPVTLKYVFIRQLLHVTANRYLC